MKIQVGKSYKTRCGDKVDIIRIYKVNSHYVGIVKTGNYSGFRMYYNEKGEAREGFINHYDIISPWEEPSTNPYYTDDYDALRKILSRAYDQAASGKGKERHANDKPFNQQPIAEIGRMVGTGYNLGQVMKKAQEAQGMANRGETDAAVREMLGVIVYAASAIMLWEEEKCDLKR